MLAVDVVPTVATTAIGRKPLARSAPSRAELGHIQPKVSSLFTRTTFSSPSPSTIIAFSTCCAPDRTHTREGRSSPRPASPSADLPAAASRAAASACISATDAVSYTIPMNDSGSATISRIQATTTPSSSVAAGDVRHVIALTLSAAAIISPSSAGPLLVLPKYPRKAG